MVAAVYLASSTLTLAQPQTGHAALAAVQVSPGLRTSWVRQTGQWQGYRALGGPGTPPEPVTDLTAVQDPRHWAWARLWATGCSTSSCSRQVRLTVLAAFRILAYLTGTLVAQLPAPQTGLAVLATPGSRFGDLSPHEGT
jgi:hypothetical protein